METALTATHDVADVGRLDFSLVLIAPAAEVPLWARQEMPRFEAALPVLDPWLGHVFYHHSSPSADGTSYHAELPIEPQGQAPTLLAVEVTAFGRRLTSVATRLMVGILTGTFGHSATMADHQMRLSFDLLVRADGGTLL